MMFILPQDSPIYESFQRIIKEKRLVFFAGIPGVGKSLWLQQFAFMAHQQGRTIHTLQWDIARVAFETPEILAKYPETDGVTHVAIRKAVGLWARQAILKWHETYPDPNHLLIGELPLIGNRLIEIVQKKEDTVEGVLASDQTLCIVPVPSLAVRATIEHRRAQTIATPQHENETKDAPPNVLQMVWEDVCELDSWLSGQSNRLNQAYNPEIYTRVFQHLLQHRHMLVLNVDEAFATTQSVYALGDIVTREIVADGGEIAGILHHLATTYTVKTLEKSVANWYLV
jgi:hypothetical protein